ncbi:MAG: zinc-binding dehydrogenase, partial [Gammaproteobacteria bacterium]|nr:zinc-binding dehydrogenase [Gammaproteobacteria bacterium]
GADRVIDYQQKDFASENQHYNIIFDTVGQSSFLHSKNSLTPNGLYLSTIFSINDLFQMLWTSQFSRKKAKFSATGMRATQELRTMLKELSTLFETQRLQSIIDRRYALTDVASAHTYIDKGHKKGNVVIVM